MAAGFCRAIFVPAKDSRFTDLRPRTYSTVVETARRVSQGMDAAHFSLHLFGHRRDDRLGVGDHLPWDKDLIDPRLWILKPF